MLEGFSLADLTSLSSAPSAEKRHVWPSSAPNLSIWVRVGLKFQISNTRFYTLMELKTEKGKRQERRKFWIFAHGQRRWSTKYFWHLLWAIGWFQITHRFGFADKQLLGRVSEQLFFGSLRWLGNKISEWEWTIPLILRLKNKTA